jgi:hypothetical protein
VSLLETRQTREYWANLGVGTLYEELPVVGAIRGRQSRRPVDGIVVMGGAHFRAESHRGVSLDDEDVVVIQTKATRLNPYVFGQGLFSADLIRLRWRPRSVRSVVICAEDDPDLRPVCETYPDLEVVAIEPDRRAWFRLTRVPGAALLVHRFTPGNLIAPARLTSRFQIDGLISNHQPGLVSGVVTDVAGQHVVTVHSYRHSLGMWIAGEVLIAQGLLVAGGCASVRSIVVVGRGDEAVASVLSRVQM